MKDSQRLALAKSIRGAQTQWFVTKKSMEEVIEAIKVHVPEEQVANCVLFASIAFNTTLEVVADNLEDGKLA